MQKLKHKKKGRSPLTDANNEICSSCDPSWSARIILAHDPNIKYGPDGSIKAGQLLTYKVEFGEYRSREAPRGSISPMPSMRTWMPLP